MDKSQVRSCISGSGSITYDPLTGIIGGGGGGTGTVTSIATAGLISGGTITTSGTITTAIATNKLVGRGTAGTGVMEEITLGTGLSLSGTTLNAALSLTVGTTPIASGTVGRILFEGAGNVLQENAILNLDTTNGLIIGGTTARGTRLTVVNSSDTATVKNIVTRNAADSTDRLVVFGDGNIKSTPSNIGFNASNELQIHVENTIADNVGITLTSLNCKGILWANAADAAIKIGQVVSGVVQPVLSFRYNNDFRAATIRGISSASASVGLTILNAAPNREWAMLVGNTSNSLLGTGGFGILDVASDTFAMTFNGSTRNVAVGAFVATARLHIRAGSATASTAPLKFTSGTLLSTAEAGAVEFLTDKAYLTITTGAARKELTLNDAALTSGVTPVATTNGRLTDGLTLAQGTYTPTLTGVTNVSSTTAFTCQYMRVGSVVTVSGKISVTPTSNNTQTILGVSLPIASNFAAEENCGGLAHTINNTDADQHGASIYADATNNRATFDYYETHGVGDNFTFTFTYRII